MELEQKPERSSQPDESSYHGPEHATLYLDYTIAHIKIDNNITVPSRKRAHGRCTLHWAKIGGWADFEVSVSHLVAKERPGKLPTLSS